jgi:hypothetical protein
MRRRILITAAMCAAGVAACADILGIEDGVPRVYDASVDAPLDATADVHDAATVDAAPEAAFSPLSCGTGNTCNFAAGEACCRTGSTTYKCVDASAACTGTYIPCDRPEQCPQNTEAGAMQCCTTDVLNDGGIYVAQSVGCVAAGKCTPIPNHYILCGDDSGADCPPEAGCGPSVSALPPFLICK